MDLLADLEDSDEPRDIELSSLIAIYPEIQIDPACRYQFSLEVPVNPSKAIQVLFPAPAPAVGSEDSRSSTLQAGAGGDQRGFGGGATMEDSHELSYLPSVRLQVVLPDGYPSEQAPVVTLGTTPSWIPPERIKQLEIECERLWEELGRDSVVFTYIDFLQQSAEDAFGAVDGNGGLKVDPQYKIAVLDYDISAKRAAFEKETFDCGVCLDPKKGSSCHRLLDCGHVFCVQCLQDFYNNAIREGDLSSVRCLAPNCAREREAAGAGSAAKAKKRKPKLITPGELLQISLEHDMVKRYVTLRYKMELESDKNTVYCPRPWCHGAARSKKHKKPNGLELVEDSDDSENENDNEAGDGNVAAGGREPGMKQRPRYLKPSDDLLSICEDCRFAFCSRCLQTWHGEFKICFPPRDDKELTAEEKASLEYLNLHTTPCPTCAAPAQKTQGCNHMICGRQGCGTHFCYLCSSWLDPSNPYSHFNQQPGGRITGCYNRLWELEDGDGADVDHGFAGGDRRRGRVEHPLPPPAAGAPAVPPQPRPVLVLVPAEIEEPDDDHDDEQHDGRAARERVALEAPLVLRIAADPAARGQPPPPAAPAPPQAPAPGPGGRQQRNQNQAAAAARRQQQRNRRGRGGVANAPGRGRGARARGGERQAAEAGVAVPRRLPELNADGGLNEADQAWIQQFVQLALNDEEDQLDSDGEDEVVFWIR